VVAATPSLIVKLALESAERTKGRTPRSIRLIGLFFKSSLMGELEYRCHFCASVALRLFWLVSAALTVRVFFSRVDRVAGWSYDETLVVVGLFFSLYGFHEALLTPNLSRISEYVRLGTLDFFLTRPVDSQFLISFRNIGIYNVLDPAFGLGLVAYALWMRGTAPGVAQLLVATLTFMSALVLLYSLQLMLQTTTFWLTNIERADAVVKGALETARLPIDFYGGLAKRLLTAVFPVALLTTATARALLTRPNIPMTVTAVAAATVAFFSSRVIWQIGLRRYNGVSS
jgi:ABC-2 type transport system permease protein